MPEMVKAEACRDHRKGIYGMIFPRWALISVIAGILGALGWLHQASASAKVDAANALKQAELVKKEFTIRAEHSKEILGRIEKEQTSQRKILQRIERKVNGG